MKHDIFWRFLQLRGDVPQTAQSTAITSLFSLSSSVHDVNASIAIPKGIHSPI